MSRRIRIAVTVAAVVVGAETAAAQQFVTVNAGRFAVRGLDGRLDRDVLRENLDIFAFRLDDLDGASVGGSWDIALGDFLEAGLGIGYYRRTAPSVYHDYVEADGGEITQDFSLRIVPVTATLRVLPFGDTPVQPYFGGGLGVHAWRYTESGTFIDFGDVDRRGSYGTFTDRFEAQGTAVGGVVLGGVRFRFGDRYALGLEMQYHRAGGVVGIENGFLEDEIDLGGVTTQATFRVGF